MPFSVVMISVSMVIFIGSEINIKNLNFIKYRKFIYFVRPRPQIYDFKLMSKFYTKGYCTFCHCSFKNTVNHVIVLILSLSFHLNHLKLYKMFMTVCRYFSSLPITLSMASFSRTPSLFFDIHW